MFRLFNSLRNLLSGRRSRVGLILCLTLVATLLMVSDATACPTCKQGIAENDPAAQSMAAGYFYSILFMMSMPFLILGTFGSFAYFSVRRAADQQAAQPQADSNLQTTSQTTSQELRDDCRHGSN